MLARFRHPVKLALSTEKDGEMDKEKELKDSEKQAKGSLDKIREQARKDIPTYELFEELRDSIEQAAEEDISFREEMEDFLIKDGYLEESQRGELSPEELVELSEKKKEQLGKYPRLSYLKEKVEKWKRKKETFKESRR